MIALDRRNVVRAAGLGAASMLGSSALTACTPSTSKGPVGRGGTPRPGGTLTAGLTGGGAADTIDAHMGTTYLDYARCINLYDSLVQFDQDSGVQNALAEEFEPNADATAWTIRVRSGVEFHNGKTLTAEDVMYSFRRVADGNLAGAVTFGPIDIGGMKALDRFTVRIPFQRPYAIFPAAFSSLFALLGIVPSDYDPRNPVGTGPFKYQSFTPGVTSTFVRNPNYWGATEGKGPFVDELVINDLPDENSQINALLSGQIDCIGSISVASMARVKSVGEVLISDTGMISPFFMRVDTAPFDDVRVRQAMRLICDREQMRDVIFDGHGTIGNDVFSPLDPSFDRSIPQRQQDLSQAKSLLAAAGKADLGVELVTWPGSQGMSQVAQIYAQQAKAAGVTVNLKNVTTTNFFATHWTRTAFGGIWWSYAPYLAMVAQSTLPGSVWRDTHFDNSRYNALYNEASATLDDAKRIELEHEMQRIDYDEGGYIIPYYPPSIDGVASRVRGAKAGTSGYGFNNYQFKDVWLA